ncbi:hypothetical protein F5Y16DRAFT_404030 [Xylariaceae sp. FL0255]|nr:hypothetical protein F5Y16DRAFT_404030 [Xylariaceae sp. FL0255]
MNIQTNFSNAVQEPQDGPELELNPSSKSTHQLLLWPPPCLQVYCLDHFVMECEIYYEQENERYEKLITYSRDQFKKKNNMATSLAPTRRQPSRQAKMSQCLPEMRARRANSPFKPSAVEKRFAKSSEGELAQILNGLCEKYALNKTWAAYRTGAYRTGLESAMQEAITDLREKEKQNGKQSHVDCRFVDPLGMECRYCGSQDAILEDGLTPRKLAPPAAMHRLDPGDMPEKTVDFRGVQFSVDICGRDDVKIILERFPDILDGCAKLAYREN